MKCTQRRSCTAFWNPYFSHGFAGHGKTLVHSSTVEKDGKSFLFPAWGGVGKTSLMSYFLSAGWNYLGDDIAVLSTDGRLHHFPLPMHITGIINSSAPICTNAWSQA